MGQKFLLIGELLFHSGRQISQLVWIALEVIDFNKILIILLKLNVYHFELVNKY